MKGKFTLVTLLLLLTSYFTMNIWADTTGIQIKLDQKEYIGLGDRMRVQVNAPELNLHSYSVQQVELRITSGEDPDGIAVTATETKEDSGIFQVYVGFNMKASDAKHKSIKVKSGSKVYIKCGNAVTDTTWKPDDMVLKFDKSEYNGYGSQPVITLDDNDLNLQYNLAEEINVTIKSSSDPSGISVKLVEKSPDSGIFIGKFGVDLKKSDDANDKIKIGYGGTFTVSYNDAANTSGSLTERTSRATWKTCTGSIKFGKTAVTGLGSTDTVTVTDQDLNLRASYVDSTTLKLTSGADPNGFTLTLYETGVSTGIFTGNINFSTTATEASKATIKVKPTDNIFTEYHDEINANNVPNKITASASFKLEEASITTSAKNDSGSGNSVDITISDPDANSTSGKDNIIASVGVGRSNNDLTLKLSETGNSSGKFKTTLYFTNNDENGQMLCMSGKNKVNIRYLDNTVPTGGSKEIIKTIDWDFQSSIMSLDKKAYIGYNSSAKVTLNNMELNDKPEEVEYIKVAVQTGQEKKMDLDLKETGKNTGKFEGTLYFGERTNEDKHIIKVSGTDSIIITYISKNDKFDVIECDADWTPMDGTITLNRAEYCGTQTPVVITVQDMDLSEDIKAKDIVKVKAKIIGTSRDTEIKLTETGANTGKFTGTLYLNGGGSPGIRMNPGESLEIAYIDEYTSSGASNVEKKVTALWTGVSEAKISLDKIEYNGYDSYMIITLTDPDQNKYPDKRDSVEVSINTLTYTTGKKYTLKETGSNTGVFTVKLKLIKETSTSSALHVRDADTIKITFTDKRVSAEAIFSK